MHLEHLAQVVREVRSTSSRVRKSEILAQGLRADSQSRTAQLHFLCGELPMGKIGVGPSVVSWLGENLPQAEESPTLSLAEVCAALAKVKGTTGSGSQARRKEILLELLSAAGPGGQKFLLRLLGGGLRQGALAGVLEQAVVLAAQVEPSRLRRAITLMGSLPEAAVLAFQGGSEALARVQVQIFRPLAPMLAATAASVEEALEKWSPSFWELKMDGARIQVHKEGDEVRVFSRALREVTGSVPEVVEHALSLKAERFIADGEVMSFGEEGRPLPFQQLMTRFGRSKPTPTALQKIPLTPHYFDLIYLDGTDYLDLEFEARRTKLEELVGESVVPGQLFEGESEASDFLEQAMDDGYEGVMVKNLAGLYKSGKRGSDWLKLKPHFTLDLVVIACEWGSGRRKGWLSNLHLAAPDKNGEFIMLGKTFKGLTDKLLDWQTEKLLQLEVSRDQHVVYVRPELVVEVAFNELQSSPHYPGGLALRFARVKRYRPDKSVAQADEFETVLDIHQNGVAEI